MNNTQFYKSFNFKTFKFSDYNHTDNSHGIDCHFLAKLKKGRARFVSDDKKEMWVHCGEVFYLPPGLKYHSYWYGDENGEIEWDSYKFNYLPQKSEIGYYMQTVELDESENAILAELEKEGEVSARGVGLLYLLLGTLFSKMEQRRIEHRDDIVERIMQYVSDNIDFQVKDLAKECDMSESGLYAFMRKNVKMTPIELKNKMRVKRAVELLQSTDMSVEEVSTTLGFGTAAYMRKILFAYVGKTPMQIRKEAALI